MNTSDRDPYRGKTVNAIKINLFYGNAFDVEHRVNKWIAENCSRFKVESITHSITHTGTYTYDEYSNKSEGEIITSVMVCYKNRI